MRKIRKLFRLLKVLKECKRYFYEVGHNKWELAVRITDEEVIKFLRKELSKWKMYM